MNGRIDGQFEFSKKKGEDKYWDSSGVLIHRCEKFYNLKNGKEMYWYSNGTLKGEGDFKMGYGIVHFYYITGELMRIEKEENLVLLSAEDYCANGTLVSKADYSLPEYYFEEFYCNGNIKKRGRYIDGIRQGPWNFYPENGKGFVQEIYKDGVMVSREEF